MARWGLFVKARVLDQGRLDFTFFQSRTEREQNINKTVGVKKGKGGDRMTRRVWKLSQLRSGEFQQSSHLPPLL